MQALEGEAAEASASQVVDDFLRTNSVDWKSKGLPIGNDSMVIKAIHNVNEETGRGGLCIGK